MARRGGNRDNDGKYLRLTGLWPSKKNDALWIGKFRNQDIGKLQDKIQEADDAGADLVLFLWENTEKQGKKDPEFTVQISVSEDDGNGRSRNRSSSRGSNRGSSRRDRDEENEDDNNNEDDDNNEDNNEESEEKEEHSSKRGRSSKKEEPKRGRGRASSSSKKDKNDW